MEKHELEDVKYLQNPEISFIYFWIPSRKLSYLFDGSQLYKSPSTCRNIEEEIR